MNKTLEELSSEWVQYKALEAEANRKRIEVENTIYAMMKKDITESGTTHIGNLKVTTGFTRQWDAEKLTAIYRTKPPVFPFKIEWKEDRRATLKLESEGDMESLKIMGMLSGALTIKPKKPSFNFAGH